MRQSKGARSRATAGNYNDKDPLTPVEQLLRGIHNEESLNTILKVAKNVAQNPTEAKFRKARRPRARARRGGPPPPPAAARREVPALCCLFKGRRRRRGVNRALARARRRRR